MGRHHPPPKMGFGRLILYFILAVVTVSVVGYAFLSGVR